MAKLFQPIEFTEAQYQNGVYPSKPTTGTRSCRRCKTMIRMIYPMPWNGQCINCGHQPFLHKLARLITVILWNLDYWWFHA